MGLLVFKGKKKGKKSKNKKNIESETETMEKSKNGAAQMTKHVLILGQGMHLRQICICK
jgi:hypothetical protein